MMYVKNPNEFNPVDANSGACINAQKCLSRLAVSLGLSLLLLSQPVKADDRYQEAERQVQAGDIEGMSATYQAILGDNPTNIRARLGYATALSWQGKHEAAQQQFSQVLQSQPDNLEALIGLGYSHAWSNQFFDAELRFNKALSIAPNNRGAQKGLGFTHLWSGQHEKARQVFQTLADEDDRDAEALAALGQAQLALGSNTEAEAAFISALAIQPDRPDALDGLSRIEQKERALVAAEKRKQRDRYVNLSAAFGNTSDGGDSGLRELSVAYSPNDRSNLWMRYDDSLSLDNPALARSGQKAETLYLGFQNRVRSDWLAIFEIGNRDLPNNADQQIYKLEGINFRDTDVLKLGVQLSPHSENYTDKLIYGGYGFALNDSWRLEPTLYLSTSGAIDDREWRAVVFAEHRPRPRWTLGLGAGIGAISSDLPSADGDVSTANARLGYSLNDKTDLNVSVRYEDTPTSSFSTTLVSIAVQLP